MAKVVYMLHEEHGSLAGGPLLGEPGLNFSALAAEFRVQCFAQCEATGDDYCFVSESDFVSWLLEREILSPMESVAVTVKIDTSGENAYVPNHWPLCPECGLGRGEQDMGRVAYSLNRAEWRHKCTKCGHAWGHHDEPYYYDKPMLDDDGRCIQSGCVPYSISQAGGLPMPQVLEVCRDRGWCEGEGIPEDKGIDAARVLGLRVTAGHVQMVAGKLTLRRLLDTLSPTKNYIVATRGHWLAVVKGENRDQADTSLRTEVTGYWEVQPAIQA